MRDLTEQELIDLEELVDRRGLSNVLDALSAVCVEKATHVADNWSDLPLAQLWERSARICETASERRSVKEVSR